jgi:uracil-DNA glycosylase family 4
VFIRTRCALCDCRYSPIEGSGPMDADVLAIGERPGETENSLLEVFCGRTGEELNETYLPLTGVLSRSDIRVENAVLCYAEGNATPREKLVLSCANMHLPDKLRRIEPSVVLLLGSSACLLSDRQIDLEYMHGYPFRGTLLGGVWKGWIWPSYHPSSGMHDGTKMSLLLEDFENLGKWMEGDWEPPKPTRRRKDEVDYQLVTSAREMTKEILEIEREPKVDRFRWPGIDTESHGKEVWSIQYSLKPNWGRLVRTDQSSLSKKLLKELQEFIRGNEIALHNAPDDLDILDKVGALNLVGVHLGSWRDTMQEAFQQCTLPQGLKPLAYRLTGAVMDSWEDIVWPDSMEAMVDWMSEGLYYASENLQQVVKLKTKTKMVPGQLEKAFLWFIKHSVKRRAQGAHKYNPWEKYAALYETGEFKRKKIPEAERMFKELYAAIGEPPIVGIGNCEIGKAVRYACEDADQTGQVAEILAGMRKEKRWKVPTRDWD